MKGMAEWGSDGMAASFHRRSATFTSPDQRRSAVAKAERSGVTGVRANRTSSGSVVSSIADG